MLREPQHERKSSTISNALRSSRDPSMDSENFQQPVRTLMRIGASMIRSRYTLMESRSRVRTNFSMYHRCPLSAGAYSTSSIELSILKIDNVRKHIDPQASVASD